MNEDKSGFIDKLTSFIDKLKKLWKEDWVTKFSIRDKPHVKVFYLKNHKQVSKENIANFVITEKKEVELLVLKGYVLEDMNQKVYKPAKKFCTIGFSGSELEQQIVDNKVRKRRFQIEGDEEIFLISKPKPNGGEKS